MEPPHRGNYLLIDKQRRHAVDRAKLRRFLSELVPQLGVEDRDLPRPAVEAELANLSDGVEAEILENVPSSADLAKTLGRGIEASAVENAWAAVSALDEAGRVEIRNRLLETL